MYKIVCILVLHLLFACSTDGFEGKVVAIADGDSFTMLSSDNRQTKVRLYGVDAPERKQPFSRQSTTYLSGLIFGKAVQIEQRDTDRYGRLVGIVRVGGLNVNEAMLKGGYAWHYKQYDNGRAWSRFEAEAKRSRLGIWADPAPVPPWKWRSDRRPAARNAGVKRTH